MKKITVLFVFVFISFLSFAQLKCHVDERFELTGIVFRLAGAEEYVNNEVTGYVEDIDNYFARYKDHELIRYAKEIREKYAMGYAGIPDLAYLLHIDKNKVALKKGVDIECLQNHDSRWKQDIVFRYVKLLNKFYRDTHFKQFFSRHKPLYAETEKRFNAYLPLIRIEWFYNFFGKPLNNLDIFVSLTNGRSNYGGLPSCSLTNPRKCIVIGCSEVDESGIPVFDNYGDGNFNADTYYVLIHELCHIVGNPIIEKYEAAMEPAANNIFPHVQEKLLKVAYGKESMLGEGLTDLFANMYFREYPFGFENYNINHNENYGFIFMRRAINFMDNFYQNRNNYPHIEDFMNQIVSFMNFCGDNIEQILFEYENSNPYVINVYPALNSVVSVDVKEIKVTFNCPMWNSLSIASSSNTELINPCMGYDGDYKYWSEDKKTFTIPVELTKGKSYGLKLPAGVFQSVDRFEMKKDFEILFKTE